MKVENVAALQFFKLFCCAGKFGSCWNNNSSKLHMELGKWKSFLLKMPKNGSVVLGLEVREINCRIVESRRVFQKVPLKAFTTGTWIKGSSKRIRYLLLVQKSGTSCQ